MPSSRPRGCVCRGEAGGSPGWPFYSAPEHTDSPGCEMTNPRRRLRLRTRWWIGVRISDLPAITTLVALTLAGWADENGCGARPSLLSIANGCRLTRRSVVSHIKDLVDAGWIRRSSGRGVSNRYTLSSPPTWRPRSRTVLGEWSGEPHSLPSEEVGEPERIK
jgi:hypothetical protein